MSHLPDRTMLSILLLAIFYSLIHSSNALATEEECSPGPYEHHVKVMLDLTDAQEEALALTRCDYQPLISDAQLQIEDAEKHFRDEVKGLDEEVAIREAFISVANAREQYVVLQVLMHKETKKLLTTEQAELLEALLEVEYLQKSVAKVKHQIGDAGNNYAVE